MMHHTTNVAAVAVPLLAWVANINPVLTTVLTLLGIAYYVQYFYRQWKSRHAGKA